MTVTHICEHCGREFTSPHWQKGRFCSRRCIGLACGSLATPKRGPRPEWSGRNHPNWLGGEYVCRGYVYVYAPTHPRRGKKPYVKRALLVAEKTVGRFLQKNELVHHINGVKDDDRPENLKVVSHREHRLLHYNAPPIFRGQLSATSKLTEDDVRSIRAASAAGEKQIPLAKRFGMSQAGIWAVIHRRTWGWLE